MAAPAAPDPLPRPGSPAELSEAFAEALARGDVEEALELWVEDATILTASGDAVQGREAIGAALRALVENGAEVEIELTRTVTAGDVALGLGTLTLRGTGADGQPFRHRSSSAVIYTRCPDGAWRVAIDAPWGLPGE
jgi:uncharacterized protein (TIGR02246 family)